VTCVVSIFYATKYESDTFIVYIEQNKVVFCVISGFRREVDENCVLLRRYAASSGNSLPTFRYNLLVPPSRVKNPFIYIYIYIYMGRAVALWLRHYATSRQVAGSIPDGVIGIFQ
jgi:hypothetical protein